MPVGRDEVALGERAGGCDVVELTDVAEDLQPDPEDLGEERGDGVIATSLAREQLADLRALIVGV